VADALQKIADATKAKKIMEAAAKAKKIAYALRVKEI